MQNLLCQQFLPLLSTPRDEVTLQPLLFLLHFSDIVALNTLFRKCASCDVTQGLLHSYAFGDKAFSLCGPLVLVSF